MSPFLWAGCLPPCPGEFSAVMDKPWAPRPGPGEQKHLLPFCVKPPTSCLISAESGPNSKAPAFRG